MRRLWLVILTVVAVGCVHLAPGGPPVARAAEGAATAAVATVYELPVDAPVLRPFEEPAHRYASGHRGVDLAARRGTTVRAAAGGDVQFAGQVGGQLWVTVAHPGGVRTSYGHLSRVEVQVGQAVARGAVLGTATGSNGSDLFRPEPGLHWSARRGERHIDPLSLVGAEPRPTLVGPGAWSGSHLVVEPYAPYEGGSRFVVLAPPSPRVDRRGYARAPNHHHLIQLPGYGTEGPHPVLDPSYLGYGDGDASTFSYRGCTPTVVACEGRPYGGTDTDLDIDQAADLLDTHLRAQQRAQPGRPVDLLGHSMGGDVATHYLTHRYDPDDPDLPPIGSLITIATPHRGSGLAYLLRAVGDDPLLGFPAEGARRLVQAAGVDGAGRVRFGSEPLARYGGERGRGRPARDPERLAELGVRVLEVAGSRDLVVGRSDAGSVGAPVVLPGGHGSVTGVEATYAAVHDHLAGRAVTGAGATTGWLSDEATELMRWGGVAIDLAGVAGMARALALDDLALGLWEVGTELIGGPNRWRADDPDPPQAPGPPRDPAQLPLDELA